MSKQKAKLGHERKERFVRLQEYLLACVAWQKLTPTARALYVEIARRYRGPDSNNGKIPYSVREAANALGVGKSTAHSAFRRLIEHGFIVPKKLSGFNVKGRVATEWLLTEYPDDTVAGQIALKLFMRWRPGDLFHGPVSDTKSPFSGTEMYPRRDCVAGMSR